MNPDDLARLGLCDGAAIVLRSPHGEIEAIVASEAGLRPGTISMAHGYGANPGSDDARRTGANTGRLSNANDGYDRVTGLPRMGAIPVQVVARSA